MHGGRGLDSRQGRTFSPCPMCVPQCSHVVGLGSRVAWGCSPGEGGEGEPGNLLPCDGGSEVMPGHEPHSQMAQHGGQSGSYISSFSPGRGGSTGQVIRRSTWSSVTLGGRMESWRSWQKSGTGEGEKRQTLTMSLDPSQSGTCIVMSTAGCGQEEPHDPPGPISLIPAAGA